MICKKSLMGILALALILVLSSQEPAKADGGTIVDIAIAAVAGAHVYHHIRDVHGNWPKSGRFHWCAPGRGHCQWNRVCGYDPQGHYFCAFE